MESLDAIPTHKLKFLITFFSLFKMERLQAFQVYITLENQFQIFIFKKK